MSDVKWYYEDQPAPIDVSLWHPYSVPPVKAGGDWNFSASPTDLWNIGKWLFGGAKKLLGIGASAPVYEAGIGGPLAGTIAAMTPGGGVTGIDTLLGAYGFSPTAGGIAAPTAGAAMVPSALSTYAPTTELMGGASFFPTTGETVAPGLLSSLAPIALPLAGLGALKMFGVLGKHDYDPMVAVASQFGTESPSEDQVTEYFNNPKTRKVSVLDASAGLSKLGYADDVSRLLQSYGLLGENGRWTDKAAPLVVSGYRTPWDDKKRDYSDWIADKVVSRRRVETQSPFQIGA